MFARPISFVLVFALFAVGFNTNAVANLKRKHSESVHECGKLRIEIVKYENNDDAERMYWENQVINFTFRQYKGENVEGVTVGKVDGKFEAILFATDRMLEKANQLVFSSVAEIGGEAGEKALLECQRKSFTDTRQEVSDFLQERTI